MIKNKTFGGLLIFLFCVASAQGNSIVCSDVAKVDWGQLGEASHRIVGGVLDDFMMEPQAGVALRLWLVADSYAGDDKGWNWIFGFRCIGGKLIKAFEVIGPIKKASEASKDELSLLYSCEGRKNQIQFRWDPVQGTFEPSKINPSVPEPDFTEPVVAKRFASEYPPVARDGHHWEGLYIVHLHVSAKGIVKEARIERADCLPIEEIFLKSVDDALMKWEFKPGSRKGMLVDAWIAIPLPCERSFESAGI